jgi:hypothetical protein
MAKAINRPNETLTINRDAVAGNTTLAHKIEDYNQLLRNDGLDADGNIIFSAVDLTPTEQWILLRYLDFWPTRNGESTANRMSRAEFDSD